MKNKKDSGEDYNITFFETCKLLKRSRKTISRYIQKGLLKPKRVKSKKGTLEYRFKLIELKNLKNKGRTDKTRPDTIRPDIRQDTEVINLLREQLIIKDKQIKNLGNKIDQLIERSREANILINGLTNRVLMVEDKNREDRQDKTRPDIRQDRGQSIRGFFKRLFK